MIYFQVICHMSAAFKGEGHECPSNAIIDHLIDMSHLLLAINSSANFVIYTWRGRRAGRKEPTEADQSSNCCWNRLTKPHTSHFRALTKLQSLYSAVPSGEDSAVLEKQPS